jgi:transposase-like protein
MWEIGRFRIQTGEESAHCPSCKSSKLRRTHRTGIVERSLSKIFGLRPYRCKECDERFFRIKTHRHPPERHLASPTETRHALRG